jgi:aspartate kinase
MTYDEARELAYMGFKLQDACFEPIKGEGIVLNVKNTNNPSHPGTRIADSRSVDPEERILGVACQENLVSIGMRKLYIDKEVGFGRKMFSVSEKMGLPYEHTLDGVDSTALVFSRKYLKDEGVFEALVKRLKKACRPEAMMVHDFALLSLAGIGMKNHLDVHARTFSALAREKIAIRMIDEGADDLSFFIGVDNDRSADAVRAIYYEFYPKLS